MNSVPNLGSQTLFGVRLFYTYTNFNIESMSIVRGDSLSSLLRESLISQPNLSC